MGAVLTIRLIYIYIEEHQGPASCLLSWSELQSPGGSRLKDTDSDDDVSLVKCGLVAVEV